MNSKLSYVNSYAYLTSNRYKDIPTRLCPLISYFHTQYMTVALKRCSTEKGVPYIEHICTLEVVEPFICC